MEQLTQEKIIKLSGINEVSVKKLTKSYFENIDKKNLTGFFYSEWGAMEYACLTMVVEKEMQISYVYDLKEKSDITQKEISTLFEMETFSNRPKGFYHTDGFLSPEFRTLIINDKPWVYFYLGFGNHLYLRQDLYQKIGNYIFDTNLGKRYEKWLLLTGIEKYLD